MLGEDVLALVLLVMSPVVCFTGKKRKMRGRMAGGWGNALCCVRGMWLWWLEVELECVMGVLSCCVGVIVGVERSCCGTRLCFKTTTVVCHRLGAVLSPL